MSSPRHRPLGLWAALLAVLALVLTVAPAHAERNDDPTDPGDPTGPALKFTSLSVGPTPAYGGRLSLRFSTNYTAQETSATVFLTPSPNSPLTDVLATSSEEGSISWATSPRFKPGSYQVTLVVGKETTSIQSSRLTVTVAKSRVTATAADDDLRVAQYRPIDLTVSLASTAPDAPLAGAYTLLAQPAAGGPDVVVQEGGYDGPGPHSFSLQQFAATHPGRWELHFLTSETPLLAFSSTRVAALEVLPSRVPTTLELTPGTTGHRYGDPSAAIAATLTPGFEVAGLVGRVRLLDHGVPTGDEVEVAGPGTVRFALTTLAVGEHSLSLEFLGNDVFDGSATAARTVTVTKPVQQDPGNDQSQKPGTTTFAAQVTGKVKLKKARRTVVVKAAVIAPGLSVPLTGQVQVLDGAKVLRTVDVTTTGGLVKVKLKLKRLKPGKHRFTVRYLGAANVLPATQVWKVKVPRR